MEQQEAYIDIRDVVADLRDDGLDFEEIRCKLFVMVNKAIVDVEKDEKEEENE